MSTLERITFGPSICHGKPTVRRVRYPVESLLELLASEMTIEEIIEDHPDLERDDLLAALEFEALLSAQRRVPVLHRLSHSREASPMAKDTGPMGRSADGAIGRWGDRPMGR